MSAMKVLAVDDNPMVCRSMAGLLGQWGHVAATAAGGQEALAVLAAGEWDVVVADIRMPGMDGLELLREIRRRWPEVSVVMITGYDMSYSYAEVVAAGATDFVTKPFQPDELEAKIQRVDRERALRQEMLALATRDALTGLGNRRHFHDTLDREAVRARRQRHPLSLIVADLDRFHDYNARRGREAGDALLGRVAELVASCLRREVDGAFRLGGDDFALLLVECDSGEARSVAKRVLGAVARLDEAEAGISLGVATLTEDEDPEHLFYRAESARLRAHRLGGDRVELAGPNDVPAATDG